MYINICENGRPLCLFPVKYCNNRINCYLNSKMFRHLSFT